MSETIVLDKNHPDGAMDKILSAKSLNVMVVNENGDIAKSFKNVRISHICRSTELGTWAMEVMVKNKHTKRLLSSLPLIGQKTIIEIV